MVLTKDSQFYQTSGADSGFSLRDRRKFNFFQVGSAFETEKAIGKFVGGVSYSGTAPTIGNGDPCTFTFDANQRLKTDTQLIISGGDLQIGAVELKNGSSDDRGIIAIGSLANAGSVALYVTDPNLKLDTVAISGLAVTRNADLVALSGLSVEANEDLTALSGLAYTSDLNLVALSGLDVTRNADLVALSGLAYTSDLNLTVISGLTNTIRTSNEGMGGTAGLSTYKSPIHFTSPAVSSSGINLVGTPETFSTEQINKIIQFPNGSGIAATYQPTSVGMSLLAGSVINVQSAPFTSGTDVISVEMIGADKSRDDSLDILKTIDQSPLWTRYSSKESWLAAAQELDATPTDAGAEIDMRGYNTLGVWGTVDIGTSTNFQLRALFKHTSAGAEEYRQVSIEVGTPSDTQTTINYNDYIVLPNADGLFFLEIPVSAVVPFVQLQVFDAADGDGQLDNLYVTKAWSS